MTPETMQIIRMYQFLKPIIIRTICTLVIRYITCKGYSETKECSFADGIL